MMVNADVVFILYTILSDNIKRDKVAYPTVGYAIPDGMIWNPCLSDVVLFSM